MDTTRLETLLMNEMVIVYKYLLKIGANKEDAEDIVQDTLYKAVKYSNTLYEEHIFAWLFKVSLHSYYNLYNKKHRQQEIYLDEEALSGLLSEDNLETRVVGGEQNENIQRVLDHLKDSYRNLILLKYVLDLSYREIGQLLSLEETQVKTYLYRARNKFKELWKEFGYDK